MNIARPGDIRCSKVFSERIKSVEKRGKRIAGCLVLTVLIILPAGCADLRQQAEGGGDRAFRAYTEELFRESVSSDTISLHYTLKEPENFGITEDGALAGSFTSDPDAVRASAENMNEALKKYDYDSLDVQNRITYDILEYEAETAAGAADYLLYEEPLSLVSGVQTQYPVVLSEYPFYDRQDADIYLQLLETTDAYFDSLMEFEREKADAGLFMSDEALDAVLEQCRGFLDMGDGNYLYSSFADRIMELEDLTDQEKGEYVQDNALAVEDHIIPAYERLMRELEELRGSGKNGGGLTYFPEGRAYYELLARRSVGTARSVEEIRSLIRRQMEADLTAMEETLGITPQQAQESAEEAASILGENAPRLILDRLRQQISIAFPAMPEAGLEVKYVPEEMEEHLSPAFYMIPAIDNTEENVIYINRGHMSDDLTLFTTLAHEGYPGHLYQTVYYEGTDPDPLRSMLDFGGYVEGWATYAEMGSYYLTPLPEKQAAVLQKNSSLILGLYALADIGIHYDGWSVMDTVEFFSSYGIRDAETVEEIYDLIIGSPANYLKYYVGYVEFLELKRAWAEEAGGTFSQKEFHEAVLGVGPAPFEIVEKYMWDYTRN